MSEKIHPLYIDEYQKVLTDALNLPLADAVFTVLQYNDWQRRMGPGPHCDAIPLTALSGLGNADELEHWQSKAASLREEAYTVGDALLYNKDSYKAVRDRWIKDHPGFGSKSYDDAVSWGCFQAR